MQECLAGKHFLTLLLPSPCLVTLFPLPSSPQHLRLLRHPNIVRYLDSETTPEFISIKTEIVVPLSSTLEDQHWEGLVRGWRDVAHGLEFLHYRVRQKREVGGGRAGEGSNAACVCVCVRPHRLVSPTTTSMLAVSLWVEAVASGS